MHFLLRYMQDSNSRHLRNESQRDCTTSERIPSLNIPDPIEHLPPFGGSAYTAGNILDVESVILLFHGHSITLSCIKSEIASA